LIELRNRRVESLVLRWEAMWEPAYRPGRWPAGLACVNLIGHAALALSL